ncbi:MAG: hypothetical protein ABI024_04220 [Vicinamibacterales bacterium]
MAHPDEVVQPAVEVPSKAIAEAVMRHEAAKTDDATPQEKKQAAVEQAHALSTRPQGSYAQLHEVGTYDGSQRDGENARLAVPDEAHTKELKAEARRVAEADAKLVAAAQKAAVAEAKPAK